MQAVLQVYYVVISIYGWWHWTREEETRGSLVVTTLPGNRHVVVALVVVVFSALTARWLAYHTHAAWPFLDSLTTWGSLYATWLEARVKLENWLYWLVHQFHAGIPVRAPKGSICLRYCLWSTWACLSSGLSDG